MGGASSTALQEAPAAGDEITITHGIQTWAILAAGTSENGNIARDYVMHAKTIVQAPPYPFYRGNMEYERTPTVELPGFDIFGKLTPDGWATYNEEERQKAISFLKTEGFVKLTKAISERAGCEKAEHLLWQLSLWGPRTSGNRAW